MPDPSEPYPVEPQPEKPATPPASAPKPIEEYKAKLDVPPLLDEFSDDADFDKDPELERAILGKSGSSSPAAAAEQLPELPEFVMPGIGEPRHLAIGGVGLLVAAMIATGINAPNSVPYRVLLTLYNTLVHTGTGVVAVYIAARLMERSFTRVELVAARMFVAVAALTLIMSLAVPLTAYGWINQVVRAALAVGAYVLLVAGSFKLWQRTPLMYVIGFHALLWLIVQLGMALAAMVGAAPAAAPAAGA
jgi:hypothetical protein